MRRRGVIFLLGALCLVAASAVEAAAQSRQYVQGQVVGIGGRRAGLNRPFSLTVNNYSSADDVQRLNAALRSGGQEELLRVLSKLNAGRIAIGNDVGVTAN